MTIPDPPQGTVVPAAIATIVTGLGGVDLGGATLMLGLPPQWPKIDAVCIAATDGSVPAVRDSLQLDPRTLGYRQSFDIVCALWSWGAESGNSAMQTRIARCGDLFDAVKAWIDAHPTLDDSVYRATLADQIPWVPLDRGDGAQCTVGFSIRVSVGI